MTILQFEVEYDIGEMVYIKTDPDQNRAQVQGYAIDKNGLMYNVTKNGMELSVYDFELTKEKDVELSTGNSYT